MTGKEGFGFEKKKTDTQSLVVACVLAVCLYKRAQAVSAAGMSFTWMDVVKCFAKIRRRRRRIVNIRKIKQTFRISKNVA